jgi:hypothetical protein
MKISELTYEEDFVIYNGVKLNLTRENLSDYTAQTGLHPKELILHAYKNSITQIRNERINNILNEND